MCCMLSCILRHWDHATVCHYSSTHSTGHNIYCEYTEKSTTNKTCLYSFQCNHLYWVDSVSSPLVQSLVKYLVCCSEVYSLYINCTRTMIRISLVLNKIWILWSCFLREHPEKTQKVISYLALNDLNIFLAD